MFGNGRSERILQMFDDQFEPTGDNYLYRKSQRGRAVKVTAAEREAFITEFRRDLRRLIWGFAGAVLVIIAVVMAIAIPNDIEPNSALILLPLVPVLPVYMYVWRRVWGAPERMLAARPLVGDDRSKAEASKRIIKRMTWGQIFMSWLFLALFAFKIAHEQDVTEGWSRLWLLFFGTVVIAGIIQAVRKLRLDNEL